MPQAAAKPARRSFLVLAGVVLVMAGVMVWLGVWQVRRGAEKQAFLGALTTAATAAPVTAWRDSKPLERVRLSGVLDEEKTAFVRATLPEGLGVYVMTPLQGDGWRVYVNRGFVKTAQNGRPPAIETPKGMVSLTGLRRTPELPGRFDPPADLALRLFPARNPLIFARALVLQGIEADYLEAEKVKDMAAPNGIDFADVIARIPDNHQVYALTWFGLAATLLGVFFVLVRRTRREQQG